MEVNRGFTVISSQWTCVYILFSYSAAEVTVILANVSKYLTYVRSSVSYVQKHLNSVREPLEFVQVNILLKTCSAYEDIQRISYFEAYHYKENRSRYVTLPW